MTGLTSVVAVVVFHWSDFLNGWHFSPLVRPFSHAVWDYGASHSARFWWETNSWCLDYWSNALTDWATETNGLCGKEIIANTFKDCQCREDESKVKQDLCFDRLGGTQILTT